MNEIHNHKTLIANEVYVGECPSISGRSTLTYVVGKEEAQGTLHLCIKGNSGHGMWCKDWASAHAIDAIVEGGVDLTAKSFQRLHPGKSINTSGFVLAALRDLGLVQPGDPNTRVHVQVSKLTFEQAVLMRIEHTERGPEGAELVRKARRKAKEVI